MYLREQSEPHLPVGSNTDTFAPAATFVQCMREQWQADHAAFMDRDLSEVDYVYAAPAPALPPWPWSSSSSSPPSSGGGP
jgi:hypothetical protein